MKCKWHCADCRAIGVWHCAHPEYCGGMKDDEGNPMPLKTAYDEPEHPAVVSQERQ